MFLAPDPERPIILNGRRLLVLAHGPDIDADAFIDAILAGCAADLEPPDDPPAP